MYTACIELVKSWQRLHGDWTVTAETQMTRWRILLFIFLHLSVVFCITIAKNKNLRNIPINITEYKVDWISYWGKTSAKYSRSRYDGCTGEMASSTRRGRQRAFLSPEPRSFWRAAGIESSGRTRFSEYVQSIRFIFAANQIWREVRESRCWRRPELSLPQVSMIVGSGDENGQRDESRVLVRMPGWVDLLPVAVLARSLVVS